MTDEELEKLARKEGAKASSELSDIELEMMAREEGERQTQVDQEALHKYKGYIDTGLGKVQKGISLLDKPRSMVMAPVIQGGKELFTGGNAMKGAAKGGLAELKTPFPSDQGSFMSLTDSKSSNAKKALAVAADITSGLSFAKAEAYLASKFGPKLASQVLKLRSSSPNMREMKDTGVFEDTAKFYYKNPKMNSMFSNQKILDNIEGGLKETVDPVSMVEKTRRDASTGMLRKNVSEQASTIEGIGETPVTTRDQLVKQAEAADMQNYIDPRNQANINEMKSSNAQIRGVVQSRTADLKSEMSDIVDEIDAMKRDLGFSDNKSTIKRIASNIQDKQDKLVSLSHELDTVLPEEVNVSDLYDMRKGANERITDLLGKTDMEAGRSQRVHRSLKKIYDTQLDNALKKHLTSKEYQAFKQRDQDTSSMINIRELMSGSRSKTMRPSAIPAGHGTGLLARSATNVLDVPASMAMKTARLNDPNINPRLNPFGLSGLQLMGSSANIPLQLANFRVPRDIDSIIANKDSVLAKIAQETNDLKVVDSVRDAIEKTPSKLETILPAIIMKFPNVFEEDRYGRINNKVPPEMREKAKLDIWNNANLSNTEKAAKVKMVNGNGYLED